MSAREPVIEDVIGIVVGVGGILVAIGRLSNSFVYPPDDPRSQPWYDPVVTTVLIIAGLFAVAVFSIRLINRLRR